MSIFDECIFNSWRCWGKLNKRKYDKPCDYFGFHKVYTCQFHKNHKVTWQDVLNSHCNVNTNSVEMTRTKELTGLQAFDIWFGDSSEINLCPDCKGQGAKMTNDRTEFVSKCETCNYTGRIEDKSHERR